MCIYIAFVSTVFSSVEKVVIFSIFLHCMVMLLEILRKMKNNSLLDCPLFTGEFDVTFSCQFNYGLHGNSRFIKFGKITTLRHEHANWSTSFVIC